MPIQSGWYEVGQVYYVEAAGVIALPEVKLAARILQQHLMPHTSKPIHTVVEVSQVKRFHLMLREFAFALQFLNEIPKHGTAVLVGNSNPLIGFSVKAASHMYRFPLYSCNTVEDGLSYLNSIDETLPPLLPLHKIEQPYEDM